MVVQRGGLVDGGSRTMRTTIMQTDGVHLTLTHTSELGLAEISGPTTVQKLSVAPVNSNGPEANTALQGMVAAVQLASMEATFIGMTKTAATLMENKIQFQMGAMIAIPEFIIAAEVMEMLMNRCFSLQKRHLLSTAMVEPVRRCWECTTLYSFLYILMTKIPAMPILVLETVLMVPAIAIMSSISAITVPVKKLRKVIALFD